MRWIRRCLLTCLLAAVMAVAPACQLNPATGQRQFNVLSESQEVDIGEDAAPEFLEEYGGEIPSAQIRQYVQEMGMELVSHSERPDLPWEFYVVDSPVINAFALPGGKIFISRGLLSEMDNEAQLASVLGHEIGHVTAQHIGQQMSQAMAAQGLLAGLGIAASASDEDALQILGVGAQVGTGLYLLSFGRGQESQADELGMRYMTRAGYNPVGTVQMLEILARAAQGPGGIEFLSTHPLPETRIREAEQLIQERYPDYDDPTRYRFGEDEFQRMVLDELADLPAPAHQPNPQRQQEQQQMQQELQEHTPQSERESGQRIGRAPAMLAGGCASCGGHAH